MCDVQHDTWSWHRPCALMTGDCVLGGVVPSISLVLELIEPNTSDARPVFMTQWNHREWAVLATARGYRGHERHTKATTNSKRQTTNTKHVMTRFDLGVVYPGADVNDVAPRFQQAFPRATMALIAARAFVGMVGREQQTDG